MNNIYEAFFTLLQVGLWGEDGANLNVDLNLNEGVNWETVYQLAQEQSVKGLVLRGIKELKAKGIELSVPKVLLLQRIGEVQVIEQRNKAFCAFNDNVNPFNDNVNDNLNL